MSPKQDLGLKEDIQCWIIYGREQQWQAMYLRSQLKFTGVQYPVTVLSAMPILPKEKKNINLLVSYRI